VTAGWEPEVDDIREMRAAGDLREFLRLQMAAGKARRKPAAKAKPPAPPGHRPGAWPTGINPPGPPPEWSIPAAAWDAAVRHYRNTEHFPDQPCNCGNCPPEETE
jgi:hypothetical protein